jgi:ribose/xylose/arabinose/galactoside ABC-type transport system permease subunit
MVAVSTLAGVVAVRSGSFALGLLAALGCGLVNGLLVAALRVPGWLVTLFTMLLLSALVPAVGGMQTLLIEEPEAYAWMIEAVPFVAVAISVMAAGVYQLLPRGGPHPSRLRERGADVAAYVVSAVLAGVHGLHLAMRMGSVQPRVFGGQWFELALLVIISGTFFGSGRANIVGAFVAALGLTALRAGFILANVPIYLHSISQQALLVVALGASAGVYVLAARRYADGRSPDARELEGVFGEAPGDGRPRLFDRALFRGPGRILPIPVHLAHRRPALRIELGWSAALVAGLGLLAFAMARTEPSLLGAESLADLGWRIVPALLLALGACAVVARGGWDFGGPAVAMLAGLLAARQGGLGYVLLLAVGVGLVNAVLVALVRLPGWLATSITFLFLLVPRFLFLEELASGPIAASPELDWFVTGGVILLALAMAGAFVRLQLAPGRPPTAPVVRWRERLADGLPYLFSSVLAAAAGVYLVQRLGFASMQPALGAETMPALILAGCWLGSGRANVLGVVLATAGVMGLEFLLMFRNAEQTALAAALAGLSLLGLAASRVVHLLAARALARKASASAPMTETPPAAEAAQ